MITKRIVTALALMLLVAVVVTADINLAFVAEASTSYCSPWETLSAINDGFEPASSYDMSHGQYGNWPETGTQWVQYNWDTAMDLNSTDRPEIPGDFL